MRGLRWYNSRGESIGTLAFAKDGTVIATGVGEDYLPGAAELAGGGPDVAAVPEPGNPSHLLTAADGEKWLDAIRYECRSGYVVCSWDPLPDKSLAILAAQFAELDPATLTRDQRERYEALRARLDAVKP